MQTSSLGAMLAAAMIIASPLPSGAQASGGNDTTGGRTSVPSDQTFAPTSADSGFEPIKRPNASYTEATCVIDFSHVADFTLLEEVSGCGVTVSLGNTMSKRSVPGSWATWASPPHAETATPHVLRTNGPTTYTLTYSKKSRITGLEAEPSPFALWDISVTFRNGKGDVMGTITRTLDGEGGARLFAARTRGVRTVTVESGADYAIAQLRVKI